MTEQIEKLEERGTNGIQYEIPDPTEVATTAVPENGDKPPDNIVVTSTGVKFKAKTVPKMAMGAITEKFNREKPKVPVVMVPAKGRKEPNKDDPDYQEALGAWELSLTMALQNLMLLRGLELIPDSVPDGMLRHDDLDWAYEADMYGIDIKNPRALYLAWIQYVAAPTDHDTMHLLGTVGRRSGISEEDVQEALNRFQR